MSRTRAKYNWFNTGFPLVYDKSTQESLVPMFPIIFYDDFIGADVAFPATGTAEAGCKWGQVIVGAAPPTVTKVADEINGVAALALTNADQAQIAVLSWGDQESLSLERGLIFETRLTFNVLPLTGTEDVQAVFGLAGAHNAALDSVDCFAWFKVESAANTALLWETEDNVVTDNDNDASTVLEANVYHIFRIDATDISAVKFYVDGALVGTGDMSGLIGTVGNVQPYFNVSKIDPPAATTGTGTMLVDYVRIFQDRS
ncbi:hypothetical protein ES705_33632 [subsurface metagenome]